jgi:bifunctional non-homologous end joining protein LigD
MKLADGLESEEDLTINRPESVLTGRTNDVLKLGARNEDSKERRGKNSSLANASKMSSAKSIENTTKNHAYETQMKYANNITDINDQQQEEFPAKVKPMLSTLVDKPFDSKDWVFEVK